jgi:ABC-type glycerol-3-phosphate transport system substrate-binding protein
VFSKDIKKCLLAEAPALEAADFVTNLYQTDKVVPLGDDAKQYGSLAISSGRVAMYVGIKGNVAPITTAATQLGFQLGMAPTPKGKGGRANRDGPQAYGLVKSAKQQEAAWKYVTFMTNLETQKVRFQEHVTLPVRQSAAKLPEFKASLAPWESAEVWQDASLTTRPLPKPARYADITPVWNADWPKILNGELAVRSGLTNITQQINTLLTG